MPGGWWTQWPRGATRTSLPLAGWAREAAPSDALRRWLGHDPARWGEFRRRYLEELDATPAGWRPLRDAARGDDLVLLYAARDREHNHAVVLRDYLLRQLPLLERGDDGGEAACWLDRVCPECGRLAEHRTGACPTCGAELLP